jgi:hypothetical protein
MLLQLKFVKELGWISSEHEVHAIKEDYNRVLSYQQSAEEMEDGNHSKQQQGANSSSSQQRGNGQLSSQDRNLNKSSTPATNSSYPSSSGNSKFPTPKVPPQHRANNNLTSSANNPYRNSAKQPPVRTISHSGFLFLLMFFFCFIIGSIRLLKGSANWDRSNSFAWR